MNREEQIVDAVLCLLLFYAVPHVSGTKDLFPRNFKETFCAAAAARTVLGSDVFNFITEQMAETNSWRSS